MNLEKVIFQITRHINIMVYRFGHQTYLILFPVALRYKMLIFSQKRFGKYHIISEEMGTMTGVINLIKHECFLLSI